jgi:hypothetical protein
MVKRKSERTKPASLNKLNREQVLLAVLTGLIASKDGLVTPKAMRRLAEEYTKEFLGSKS